METFDLAPWEITRSGWAPVSGEAHRPLKSSPWLLRNVELIPKIHVVFARHIESTDVGNWIICKQGATAPKVWAPQPPATSLPDIVHQIEGGKLVRNRYFAFKAHSHPRWAGMDCVSLTKSGVGAWLTHALRPLEPFRLEMSDADFQSNSGAIYQQLLSQLEDENSSISLAARWFDVSDEAKTALILGEHLGTIQQVMRWGLINEPRLWAKDSRWTWSLGVGTDFGYLWKFDVIRRQENIAVDFPFLRELGRFLIERCIPHITKAMRKKHPCVGQKRDWIDARVSVETPTAHEQIEAALQLRDWLQKHAAPAQLLALLRL